MKLKNQVIRILYENKGEYVSGAVIAKSFNVSRNAIWKAVNMLKKSGYEIEAIRNRGYRLSENSSIFSEQIIRDFLPNELRKRIKIEIKEKTASTNADLKDVAEKGAEEGYVLFAHEQTAGKGRLGRNFYSPPATGLYMSILLRPRFPAEQALYITTCAAVAVSEAIDNVASVSSKIKWVNDVYLDGKKVCGILTEASVNFESGGLNYAVCGIGVNISTNDFSDSLSEIAGCISKSEKDLRAELAAEIIKRFFEYYDELEKLTFLDEYRKRSFLIDKQVHFIVNNKEYSGVVVDIDEKARLVVRLDDGSLLPLSSGEVQLKKDEIIK